MTAQFRRYYEQQLATAAARLPCLGMHARAPHATDIDRLMYRLLLARVRHYVGKLEQRSLDR